MTKRAETTAEALRFYGASEEDVAAAVVAINEGHTHITRKVHLAVDAAWKLHVREYGLLIARMTPRGYALRTLLDTPIEVGQDRRVAAIGGPPAGSTVRRPTLTLPKRK